MHEEFQRPQEKTRVDRLTRHLYDIEKLMLTPYAQAALNDAHLYQTIVAHRSHFTPITGVDYANHNPDKIQFIPPTELLNSWENDYKQMQENMIYGESLPFADLIENLTVLQRQINGMT